MLSLHDEICKKKKLCKNFVKKKKLKKCIIKLPKQEKKLFLPLNKK